MRSLKSTILMFFEKVRILRILSYEMQVLKLRKLYKRKKRYKKKKKEKLAYMDRFHTIRASPSAHVNSSKIEKGASFTHFKQKNTHISGCKVA